jgi:type I restriction-modification system DNA methylase subunit
MKLGETPLARLTRFASAEGKNVGQFYTPSRVVHCPGEIVTLFVRQSRPLPRRRRA